jgi:predicted carbohydrate-binding protein with CBM5 and CBM33 domain
MKTLATLLLILFSSVAVAQEYKVVQINTEWNDRNKVVLPYSIEGAKTVYAFLENQTESLQKQIQAVPIIILFKDNKPLRQWSADLSFKLNINIEEIAYAIREDKQTHFRARSN